MNSLACIFQGSNEKSRQLHRCFGLIVGKGEAGHLLIVTADGEKHHRTPDNVATYIQPPADWDRLYRCKEVRTERRTKD